MHESQRPEVSERAAVRAMYDETADDYATMMDAEIELPVYDEVLGRLAERLLSIDGPVLDVACGSGHMLERLGLRHVPGRELVGIDLSQRMVELAAERLTGAARVVEGDMCVLAGVAPTSVAAVVSFYALHHLDPKGAQQAFRRWAEVLRSGGQLVLATWEGRGTIDYGGHADLTALRYSADQVRQWAEAAGLAVHRCAVEPVDGFPMDAVHLEAFRP